jgi:hypothetical protein
MTADDPYTDTIPGFISAEQLTREWAQEHLGTRLDDFARALAEEVTPPVEGQVAA